MVVELDEKKTAKALLAFMICLKIKSAAKVGVNALRKTFSNILTPNDVYDFGSDLFGGGISSQSSLFMVVTINGT